MKEENAIDFAHEHINAEPKQCMNSLEYLLANAGENINKQLRNRKMQDVDLYIRDIINMLKIILQTQILSFIEVFRTMYSMKY